MQYDIQYGNSAFAVPGSVVDHFLRLAGEKEIKVLLFLLRYAQQSPTAETIAEFLRITPEAVGEALDFWAQAGIIGKGNPQLMTHFAFSAPEPSASPVTAATAPVPPAASPAPVPTVGAQRSSKEIKLDPSEIASIIEESPELKDVFALAEKKIGRPVPRYCCCSANIFYFFSMLFVNQATHIIIQ